MRVTLFSRENIFGYCNRLFSIYKHSAWQLGLEETDKGNRMSMFIHFFCLCSLGPAIKLNFNSSKVAFWNTLWLGCLYEGNCLQSLFEIPIHVTRNYCYFNREVRIQFLNTCMETKISSLHVHEICHFVPNTYNIWNIIIQSVFIDNHPTSTFNPQTWNKLNSKHLRISVDLLTVACTFCFSIQILSHILGKQNPVKEIAKFTVKLDQEDTCVYKHGQKH